MWPFLCISPTRPAKQIRSDIGHRNVGSKLRKWIFDNGTTDPYFGYIETEKLLQKIHWFAHHIHATYHIHEKKQVTYRFRWVVCWFVDSLAVLLLKRNATWKLLETSSYSMDHPIIQPLLHLGFFRAKLERHFGRNSLQWPMQSKIGWHFLTLAFQGVFPWCFLKKKSRRLSAEREILSHHFFLQVKHGETLSKPLKIQYLKTSS